MHFNCFFIILFKLRNSQWKRRTTRKTSPKCGWAKWGGVRWQCVGWRGKERKERKRVKKKTSKSMAVAVIRIIIEEWRLSQLNVKWFLFTLGFVIFPQSPSDVNLPLNRVAERADCSEICLSVRMMKECNIIKYTDTHTHTPNAYPIYGRAACTFIARTHRTIESHHDCCIWAGNRAATIHTIYICQLPLLLHAYSCTEYLHIFRPKDNADLSFLSVSLSLSPVRSLSIFLPLLLLIWLYGVCAASLILSYKV